MDFLFLKAIHVYFGKMRKSENITGTVCFRQLDTITAAGQCTAQGLL